MAAKTSKVTSVTMELPFWKKMPAMAGRRASPRGDECQCDSSRLSLSFNTRGRNRSSVEDRMELRASDIESDRVELRRSSPAEREGISVMISFPWRWRGVSRSRCEANLGKWESIIAFSLPEVAMM